MSYSLLIKPASAACNLRCRYCFYFDHQAMYPERHFMTEETLERLVRAYLQTEQPVYVFGWQGGEPTLLGVDFFRRAFAWQKKYGVGKTISNALQTNATRIDAEFAAFLKEANFLVGVSLDGTEEMHNRYRLQADGTGSYAAVQAGIRALREAQVPFNILTLVSQANVHHGREVYQALTDAGHAFLQFIPCVEGTADAPASYAISGAEWGTFLTDVFDAWIAHDTRRVSVRNFDVPIGIMNDGSCSACTQSGTCRQYFVVESDGSLYPCDFHVTEEYRLGTLAAADFSFDALFNGAAMRAFGQRKADFPEECRHCRHLDICSGDCPKHRVFAGAGSASWLCEGYRMFYDHARGPLEELVRAYRRERGMSPMLFTETAQPRNENCFCGSGKKYKKCHGAE